MKPRVSPLECRFKGSPEGATKATPPRPPTRIVRGGNRHSLVGEMGVTYIMHLVRIAYKRVSWNATYCSRLDHDRFISILNSQSL
jgi:hypothetical protein